MGEGLDPLDVDDLAGALITLVQDISGVEINPEPLMAAARTLIEDPASFDPNVLTIAVAQAIAQETLETEDPGTVIVVALIINQSLYTCQFRCTPFPAHGSNRETPCHFGDRQRGEFISWTDALTHHVT